MGNNPWLKKPSDFRRVFREGKRFVSPHFVLYVRECSSPQEPGAKLGVSLLKGHIKLATRRNKLRRVAKELFRKELAERFLGHTFIVRSKSKSLDEKTDNLSAEIKGLYEKFAGLHD